MSTAANSGARIKRVEVTDERITAHLADGRVISVPLAWSWNQRWAMRYKIALLKTDEGYSVSVPGLPGCWSQGATEEEALQNNHSSTVDRLRFPLDSFPRAPWPHTASGS